MKPLPKKPVDPARILTDTLRGGIKHLQEELLKIGFNESFGSITLTKNMSKLLRRELINENATSIGYFLVVGKDGEKVDVMGEVNLTDKRNI